MKNIKRTLITIAVATLALVSVPTTVEAATKVYKATDSYNQDYDWGASGKVSQKKGQITLYNGGEVDLSAGVGRTIYYEYKAGTTKVSAVKTPNTKSKKIKSNKYKTFKVTKNTVVKFKVVKGKVTKTKLNKAKTYYFVCKVQKNNNFMITRNANQTVSNYGKLVTLETDGRVCDKVVYTLNGGKKKTVTGDDIKFQITGPTTIKVTGYKMGKKLGTYTYNYDVKKYAPKKMHDYALKGSLPNEKWIDYLTIPYGDGYAVAYTLNGSTPSLTNGKFVTEFEEDTHNFGYMQKTDCPVERFNQYGKVTVKVQVYKKMYYKNTSNQYVFAGYEPVGGVQTKTYKTWAYNPFRPSSNVPYSDPAYDNSILYMSYIAPTTQESPHLTKMQVTYVDVNGYMVTVELEPGQKLTDVHTKAQRLGSVVTFYVDGENVYEEVMQAKIQYFVSHLNGSGYEIKTVTYDDYLDSFTNHPAKVCTGITQ